MKTATVVRLHGSRGSIAGAPREQRRQVRTLIREELRVLSLETMAVIHIITCDFSDGGLGFSSLTPFKLGDQLVIPLYLDDKRMLILGRVRHVRWMKDRSYGVGVEFLESIEAPHGAETVPLRWHGLALENDGFTSRRRVKPSLAPSEPHSP